VPNVVEFAADTRVFCEFFPPPSVWGRVGVGGLTQRHGTVEVLGPDHPPTLALPHEAGGDFKASVANVLQQIQSYCP
jgi:hypothetical protein